MRCEGEKSEIKYRNIKIKKLAIEKDNKLLPMALEYDSNVIVEHNKKKEEELL